jgi:hypothetical protein
VSGSITRMTSAGDEDEVPDQSLAVMDSYTSRCLLQEADPYQLAIHAMGALTPFLESGELGGRLYCIWGELTDRVELGRQSEEQAEVEIRLMSREWLAARGDSGRVAAFVDRWYYDECGYQRP